MDKDQMVEGIMKSAGISKANVYRFYDGLVGLAKKTCKRGTWSGSPSGQGSEG